MVTDILRTCATHVRTCALIMLTLHMAVASAAPITAPEVERFYARYMHNGRSSVEMQYQLTNADAGASGERDDDHVHMSMVRLYEVPEKLELETEELREFAKRWVFIHESEHALIIPYLDPKRPNMYAPIEVWVQYRLMQQVHENAADARAIARIWKKDGAMYARALAAVVLPFRDGDGVAHQTQCAIRATIATLELTSARMESDADEFNEVLDIALRCARSTAQELLGKNVGVARADALMHTPRVVETLREIEVALGNVKRDYVTGRFPNDAATIRFSPDEEKWSDRDYHFFVGTDGTITREQALGGEGARGLIALRTAMEAPKTPERFFAIEAVKRVGTVTRDRINDTEIVFTRFVRAFAGDSQERRTRAFAIMARVIGTSDPRLSLGELYSEVNRRLMFDLGFPAQ